MFRVDVGRYPTQQEGLEALVNPTQSAPNWNGPYLKKESALQDPWGNPYLYQIPGQHGEVDVYSLETTRRRAEPARRRMSEAGSNGFTLLEMLVVIAITAMISGIVAANMERTLDALELQQNVRLLQADLRVARATALRTGKSVDLEATDHGHEYDWIGGSRFLPAGITLSMSRPFVVYPDGSVDAPPIVMSSERRSHALAVDPVTGGVTVDGQ